MVAMREILVDWTTSSGGGKVSVFYGFDATPVGEQRTTLNTFLASILGTLTSATTYNVRTSGREMESTTGALLGEWSDPTARTGTGSGPAPAVADATQALVRWNTEVVVAGRFLKGRTFIPGLSANNLSGGNLTVGAQTLYNDAIAALAAAGDQLAVWHRPVGGVGGDLRPILSGSVWNELAVLRRRRG